MFHPFLLAALATSFLALTGYTTAGDSETLRIRADSWMPFNGAPGDARGGYVVDTLRAIFESKGIAIEYQNLSWEASLKAVNAGEIEGVIGADPAEAKNLIFPKEPVGMPRVALVSLKKSAWIYENIRSLDKVRLGAIEGYGYWESLDSYIKDHNGKNVVMFQGEAPLPDAIAKLHSGEIDVVVETLSVFVWAARTRGHPATDYRIVYSHTAEPIYVAFANNEAGRRNAKLFDKGIDDLRASGKLATILKPYGLTDWK